MKNSIIYIVIGILLVLAIISIMKLNQVQGAFSKVATKFPEAGTSSNTSSNTSVSARDFVSQLTDKLKGNLDSVTLNFDKTQA